MDPFVATIVKQGLVLGLGAGAVVFLVFCMIKMADLKYAMTLPSVPAGLA